MAEYLPSPEQLGSSMYYRAPIKRAQAEAAQYLPQLKQQEVQSGQQIIDMNKIKIAAEKLDYSLQSLAQVKDQATYNAWRLNMHKIGVDTTGDPDIFTEEFKQQSLIEGVSMKDRLQIQALAAYRQNSLALKAANTFGSVQEAALNGYRRADDGVNWQPIEGQNTGNSGLPNLYTGSANQSAYRQQNPNNGAIDPITGLTESYMQKLDNKKANPISPYAPQPPPLPQQGPTQSGAPIGMMPAQQAATMPVKQQTRRSDFEPRPGETIRAYQTRMQSKGGVVGALAERYKAADSSLSDSQALALAKAGVGVGNYLNPQTGMIEPMPGILQTKAAQEEAGEAGKKAVNISEEINEQADAAFGTKRVISEMKQLGKDVQLGKLAPVKQKLGEWATQFGVDPEFIKEQFGNPDSAQAINKLTAALATQSMKAFTSRGTQMEFSTFLANNPNIALTPGGFEKVASFIEQGADIALEKQKRFTEWKQGKNPKDYHDFSSEWNQYQLGKMRQPSAAQQTAGGPPGGKLIGTSGGKPVYQLPDGTHVMGQ